MNKKAMANTNDYAVCQVIRALKARIDELESSVLYYDFTKNTITTK